METINQKKSGTRKIVLGLAALIVLIAVFALCYNQFRPETQQGTKQFTVEVIDDKGTSTMYEGSTDAEYLRQALEELKAEGLTIEGTEEAYGLMIHTVNGLKADYSVNQSYWSILVNGEIGDYGVDTQPVTDGDAFTIVYMIYEETVK